MPRRKSRQRQNAAVGSMTEKLSSQKNTAALQPRQKEALFEEEDGVEDKLPINKSFAEHFEDSRRRRELARAREMGLLEEGDEDGDEDEDSSSLSSDEDDDVTMGPQTDLQIMRVIQMIRKKDPRIYDPNVRWFDDNEGGGTEEQGTGAADGGGRHRRQRATDVLRNQILQAAEEGHGDAFASDEDDGETGPVNEARWGGPTPRGMPSADDVNRMAYNKEQQDLRNAFLQSVKQSADALAEGDSSSDERVEDDDGTGGLLQVRRKSAAEVEKEASEFQRWMDTEEGREFVSAMDPQEREALRQYLVEQPADKEEAFLRQYMVSRKWEQDERDEHELVARGEHPTFEEIVGDVKDEETSPPAPGLMDDDEDDVDAAEDFERRYNFRFEEAGGTDIVGHPRTIEDSVRRKDDARKRRREARKQRKEEEKRRLEAETKRLINLKRAELKKQYERIQWQAGDSVGLDTIASVASLDEDFDPAKHDALMSRMFDEGYYAAEEGEEGEDGWMHGEGERPAWAGERADGLDAKGGALQAKPEDDEALALHRDTAGEAEVEDDDDVAPLASAPVVAEAKALEKNVDEHEEVLRLGFDDVAAGRRTRFKYRPVSAEDFGLSAADILFGDEKDLNRYVSLKKMAPYREKEWFVPPERKKKLLPVVRQRAVETARQVLQPKGGRKRSRAPDSDEDHMSEPAAKQPRSDHAGGSKKKAKKSKTSPAAVNVGGEGTAIRTARLASYGLSVGDVDPSKGKTKKNKKNKKGKKNKKHKGEEEAE